MIGVLGGMGPAATADFLSKLVALTPADCDQHHLPILVANLPHVPDRSRHLAGLGPSPLPHMLSNLSVLNQARVSLVVVPCNTSHHWFDELAAHSQAPMLNIAQICVAAAAALGVQRVSLFATRGTLQSGFYARELARLGIEMLLPHPHDAQTQVDACIRSVKAGDLPAGAQALQLALADATHQNAQAVILACTELPIAAQHLQSAMAQGPTALPLIDSTLELARATVAHGRAAGWHLPEWSV